MMITLERSIITVQYSDGWICGGTEGRTKLIDRSILSLVLSYQVLVELLLSPLSFLSFPLLWGMVSSVDDFGV